MSSAKKTGDRAGSKPVGYGKPPKEHQFKKGASGNPKGRPAKSMPGRVDITSILDEPIAVSTAKGSRVISGFEIGVRKLVRRAVKDRNLQAAIEFVRLCAKYKVIVPPPVQGGGVLVIPKGWASDQWIAMLERHGPPPWPGPRSGLPE